MPTRSLLLVRHAIAATKGEKWPDDAERPLTHEGAARMRQVVAGLESLNVEIDVLLTSPLVRAVQTAEIIVQGLAHKPRVEQLPLLAPGSSPLRIAEALTTYAKFRSLALVGHEPGLGELAAWLIGSQTPLEFKKGGVCRIDTAEWPPARRGRLRWLATPKMLRALA